MKKKIVIVLFITIGLIMGGALLSPDAGAAAHRCWVPYNIYSGNWSTGIHITANYYASEDFEIKFFNGTGNYKTVHLDLDDSPGGWTGTIKQLFDLPEVGIVGKETNAALVIPNPFTSPSFMIISSTYDYFTVSQFVMNSVNGFGFQTFYSYPLGSWPYTSSSSGPLYEPQGAGGDSAECAEPHAD
ncbi:MAG: hypothetical protein PHY29_05810 [Syntrophales bacterium]|nr:hypothetical protein [Syntrophales bacterium]